MSEENVFGARPNLFVGDVFVLLNLPFVKVRHGVNDEPWDASTKVDDLKSQHGSGGCEEMPTSWTKKDKRPVAMMGLPIQM